MWRSWLFADSILNEEDHRAGDPLAGVVITDMVD